MIYELIVPHKRWPKPHALNFNQNEKPYFFDTTGLLRREIREWLEATVGKEGQMWNCFWYDHFGHLSITIPARLVFARQDHAMLFRLTWTPA